MKLVTVPDGTKGIDCNTVVLPAVAAAILSAGYHFVVRYVRRAMPHSYDLTRAELDVILNAGLGLMIVQHVASDPWVPTLSLGRAYGQTAAAEAALAGVPPGAILWLDLEGVAPSTSAKQILDYANAWYDAVTGAGYDAGIYLGDGCGLTAEQSYHGLKFKRFWSAYNLNSDQVPVTRGVQMRQHPFPGSAPGIPFEFDWDQVFADLKGGRVTMLVQ